MSKLIISKSFFIIITVLGCISLIATTIIYLILTFFTSGQGGVKFGTLEFIFTIIYAVFPFCLFVGVVVKIRVNIHFLRHGIVRFNTFTLSNCRAS
jgi:hypothetical protein